MKLQPLSLCLLLMIALLFSQVVKAEIEQLASISLRY